MPKKPPETLIVDVIRSAISQSAHEAKNRKADETDQKAEVVLNELEKEKKRIEKARLRRDHERGEDLRDAVNKTLIGVFRVAVWGIIALGGIWASHLILPLKWHWLSEAQLATIHNIFTGGIISSVLIEHFRRRL